MKDTNLSRPVFGHGVGSSPRLPMTIHLEWWEPPLARAVHRTRRRVRGMVQSFAHDMGLTDFKSTVSLECSRENFSVFFRAACGIASRP